MADMQMGSYQDVTLPLAEIDALHAFAALLYETGVLTAGMPMPLLDADQSEHAVGFTAHDQAVLTLSARYCGLTALPESLSHLQHLRLLDVTGNRLQSLPESLGNLSHLRTLVLDANQLSGFATIGAPIHRHIYKRGATTRQAALSLAVTGTDT